jgi:hypothetical protein
MTRVASTLVLLALVMLLASRLVSPAASSPSPQPVSTDATSVQADSALRAVNSEVDRLRDRLTIDVPAPTPRRDPFTFGAWPVRARDVSVEPAAAEPAAPALPRLVAIIGETSGDVPGLTAVFDDTVDVQFMTIGKVLGRFQVHDITVDTVTLIDTVSRASFVLSIR